MKKLYVVKCLLLVVLLGVGKVCGQVIYTEDFGTSSTVNLPYVFGTNATGSASKNINLSSPSWTQTIASGNFAGSSGGSMSATIPTNGGSNVITCTFTVPGGYTLSPTSVAYNYRISGNGPQKLDIGISGSTGSPSNISQVTTTRSGNFVGVATSSFVTTTTLTGTITITINFSSTTNTNATVRLDDFTINGTIASCAPPSDPTGTITPGSNPACSSTTLIYSNAGSSYYWQTSATGTSTSSVTTTPLNVTTSGTFYVRAYNGTCWSTGSLASSTITINTAPSITTNPSSPAAVCGNASGNLTTAASGTNLTYQWQYSADGSTNWTSVTNGTPNTGVIYTNTTTTTLNISALTQTAYFRASVSNPGCSSVNSGTATVTVNPLPTDPIGTISPGSNPACTLTTLSYSNAGPSYYWQTSATGTSTTSPTTTPLTVTSSGTYYIRQYNGTCWSANSLASPFITINTAPAIAVNGDPDNASVEIPNSTSFSVTATGTITSYQWQVSDDGGATWTNVIASATYSNETTSSLAINNSTGLTGNQYRCLITGPCGTVTSASATLTAYTTAYIWTNPISGIDPYTANPYATGQTLKPNLSVSGIGRGTGIVGTGSNNRYNANSWDVANIDLTKYFSFTLTPASTYKIDFNNFVYSSQRSSTGPNSFSIRSSIDGFTTDIASPPATGGTFSLSGLAFQNITSAITFRIYAWGASASAGTFSINDFTFNGSISLACALPLSPISNSNVTPQITDVNPSCFAANWSTASGATGYYLDVSLYPTFATTSSLATDLFISEYVEGSSNNKYIEIYNGTGNSINLSLYNLRLFSNGSSTPNQDIPLTGTLANGSTIVYKNSGATPYTGTSINNLAVNFNGNDAIGLYKPASSAYADIFGRIAENPGTAWTNSPFTTIGKTLVRNPSVTGGITTNPSSGFPTLAAQWTQYETDDVSHLGSHTFTGTSTPSFVTSYNNKSEGTVTTDNVTGLAVSTNYYYRVRAINSCGASTNSNVVAVTTTNQTTSVYRSKQSGNYNDPTTWEYDLGCTAGWAAVTVAPGAGNNVTIMASHIVTLDANSVISTGKTLTINSAGSLIMNDKVLSGAGAFTLSPGSILSIGSVNGIALTSATGNVQTTGTRSYSTGADYTYAGTAPQITGDGLPATVHNLNINNTTGVTSTNGIGIGDSMTVNGLFTPLAGQVISGAGLLTGTGTVKVTRATGTADFVGQYSISNKTLIDLIVDFAGASAQGVSANTFGGLTVTNPSGVIMSGNVAIGNVLNLPTATLAINGNILTANGTITGSGKLKGSSTSELVVNGTGTLGTVLLDQSTDSITNVLKALTVNRSLGSVTLGNRLYITDVLTPTDGNLISNGNLTIRSTSIAATARVGQVGTSASVTGNVTVERFFTKRRAYRFISPSVNNSTATGTIKANWMEGVNNPNPSANNNPKPGYGVQISGVGGAANGFDPTNTNNPSLYTFNNNSQMWNAFPNTGGLLIEGSAWRLFSRGGRATNLTINAPDSSTTIIRATGTLNTGTFTYNTTAGTNVLSSNPSDYNLIGNPYASPVSWLSLVQPDPVFPHASTGTAFHILPSYTAWDLNIGKRGSYVTYNGVSGVNSVTASEVNNLIQSGQAFFIQNAGTNPSLQFQEAFKSNGANTRVYRTSADTTKMSVQLLYSNSGSTQDIADALVAVFDDNFSKAIGNEDSYKFPNTDENIAINENGTSLSIEGRPNVNPNDTMFLKIWQLRQKTYYLSIDAQHFSPSVNAYLKDLYLNQETSIDLSGNTLIPFSLTADSASFASNRFMILFRPSSTLPVTVTDVKAYRKDKDIQVEWTVQTEKNILRYEVEKSPDGRNFEKAGSIASKGNNATASVYSWPDEHVNPGYHFYRIKVIDKSGSVSYTKTVKVLIAGDAKGIAVFPNPVKSNIIGLQLNDLENGKYNVVLYNNLGQKLYSTVIEHAGGSEYYKIVTGIVSKGSYRLSVNNGDELLNAALIFE